MRPKTKTLLLSLILCLLVGAWCLYDGYALLAPPGLQRNVLTTCLVLEAGSEGPRGMQAVMNVIVNRANGNPAQFYAEATRAGQFASLASARERFIPNYRNLIDSARRSPAWEDAEGIVELALQGQLPDITGGATHFYGLSPGTAHDWAEGLQETVTIGKHRFLKASP